MKARLPWEQICKYLTRSEEPGAGGPFRFWPQVTACSGVSALDPPPFASPSPPCPPGPDPQGGRVPSGTQDSLSVSGPGPWCPHAGELPSPERQAWPGSLSLTASRPRAQRSRTEIKGVFQQVLVEAQGLLKESLTQLAASGPLLHCTSSGALTRPTRGGDRKSVV